LIVGAAGIELPSLDPESSGNVARTRESGFANSPGATVGDESRGPEAFPTSPIAVPADTDDAIFAAYKAAKAVGDFDRARALLDLLAPKSAAVDAVSVTPLALVRGEGGRQ
jgi:hypothetical protein